MIGNRIVELGGGLASVKLSVEDARTRKRRLVVRARYGYNFCSPHKYFEKPSVHDGRP